jgi:hypothetical protein
VRYNKIGYLIGLSIILALLVLLSPVPAHAAAATEVIYLQDSMGQRGDWIGVNVFYFETSKVVRIYFSSDEAGKDDTIGGEVTAYEQIVEASTFGRASGGGSFVGMYFFVVPDKLTDGERQEDVHDGDYYVYATYYPSTSIVCKAEFTVIDGELALDPEEGVVGGEVEISGEGLRPNQKIGVEYDGDKVDIISGDSETDGAGHFSCTIILPEGVSGGHTITVTDESGDTPQVEFIVKPKLTLAPSQQAIGEVVQVSGRGFAKKEAITLVIDSQRIDTTPAFLETDDLGSFNGSFVVPFFDSCGTRKVAADDYKGVKLTDTELAVLAGIVLTPLTSPASPGHVGMELGVRGIGFIAGSDVIVAYVINDEAIPVVTAMADDEGELSVRFTVPPSAVGSHAVAATDGIISVTSTFTMESQPPPPPHLLLPEIGSKSEAGAYFDWEDVADPSGVSYTLQVATDANFTNIVLEEEGLPQSEYAMPEGEELAPTKATAPYYWRVRAVDRASNEGDWSPSGLFRVGFSWRSNWALYIFSGLGALLLVIVFFWWQRRHAASPKQ